MLTVYPSSFSSPYKIYVQPEISEEDTKQLFAIDVVKHLIPKWDQKVFEEIKQTGKNKVTVITYNRQVANTILKIRVLKINNLNPFIPTSYIYKKSIIKNIPVDIDIENKAFWKDNLRLYSLVKRLEIEHVQRFHRRELNS